MMHRDNFFINVTLSDRSRLLTLIHRMCGTEISIKIVLQKRIIENFTLFMQVKDR